jgi:hypothetical protein
VAVKRTEPPAATLAVFGAMSMATLAGMTSNAASPVLSALLATMRTVADVATWLGAEYVHWPVPNPSISVPRPAGSKLRLASSGVPASLVTAKVTLLPAATLRLLGEMEIPVLGLAGCGLSGWLC